MKNNFFKRINNKKGFTLVELIVVIAILGILATIAVPRFTSVRQQANKAVDDQAIVQMNKALALKEAETGVYPTTDAEIKTAVEAVLNPIPTPKVKDTYFFFYKGTDTAVTNRVVAAKTAAEAATAGGGAASDWGQLTVAQQQQQVNDDQQPAQQ